MGVSARVVAGEHEERVGPDDVPTEGDVRELPPHPVPVVDRALRHGAAVDREPLFRRPLGLASSRGVWSSRFRNR